MNKNLNIQLNEMVRLINYNRSITLLEQTTPKKSKSSFDDPSGSNGQRSKSSFDKGVMISGNELWWEDWDAHDWATAAELGLLIVGVVLTATGVGASAGIPMIGSASSAVFAASTVAGITDAAIYFSEDKPESNYMGTMMLALSVIPGGEFFKAVKSSKNLLKNPAAKNIVGELADESAARALLNKTNKTLAEKQAAQHILDQGVENKNMINYWLRRAAKSALKVQIKNKSLRWILGLLKKLGKTTVMIAGTPIAVDVIWLLSTTPESKYRKMRDESSFGQLLDLLYVKAGVKNESGIETLKDMLTDELIDDVMKDEDLQKNLDQNFEKFMRDLEEYKFDSEAKKLNVY